MNQNIEARSKLIEAIVAEPYNRSSWSGLANWLKQNNLDLHRIRLHDHVTPIEKDDNTVEVTLDPHLRVENHSAHAWIAG
jgi:hypothetical protein